MTVCLCGCIVVWLSVVWLFVHTIVVLYRFTALFFVVFVALLLYSILGAFSIICHVPPLVFFGLCVFFLGQVF